MIELRNIKKYYKMGDTIVKALDDVSLKIEDGEFVTIIGPSGSGKSTMMNIIGCLDKATSGKYLVDGVEISKLSDNKLAYLRNKKMGFIFQGFNLLQNLSAYENVDLPLIYQGLAKSERKKRVNESLKMVGMSSRMKHKPSELSGGQQQRVAIARALATKPMCILADEPTGNLDSVTGSEIIRILKDLNRHGTTVIIITHNDEIANMSRRVVRIYDGKIQSDTINEEIEPLYKPAKNDVLDDNYSENFINDNSEKIGQPSEIISGNIFIEENNKWNKNLNSSQTTIPMSSENSANNLTANPTVSNPALDFSNGTKIKIISKKTLKKNESKGEK